jgi:hypothetical protein
MVGGASRQVGSAAQYHQPQGLIWDFRCPTPELPPKTERSTAMTCFDVASVNDG